jgi:aspartate/methionine/tyrosine aminotransferase
VALHVGEPHVRMPAEAVDAYCAALRDGHTAYSDAPGLPALRESLVELFATRHGLPTTRDRIFVGPGSCQLISAIFASLAVPGGSVVMPEVHWPMHLQQVLLAGLEPRFAPVLGAGESIPDILDRVAGERTVAVLINSPANPSGATSAPDTLQGVYTWAQRRNVALVSDEAYEDFVYAGEPPQLARLDAQLPLADRIVFSVHTFSKGYSMTGCRLGFAAAPNPDRAGLLARVQEATLVAPSTPVQYAGLGALRAESHLQTHHDYVRRTRDAVLRALPADLVYEIPDGGWYLLLDVSAHTRDSYALARELLTRADVAIAPGLGFVPAGHPLEARLIRISLCGERERTLAGVAQLVGYLAR